MSKIILKGMRSNRLVTKGYMTGAAVLIQRGKVFLSHALKSIITLTHRLKGTATNTHE